MKPTTLDSIFRENQNVPPSEPETIEIGDGIAKGAQALLEAIEAKEAKEAERIDAAYQAERAAKEEGEALTRQASDYMRQHWQAEENRDAEHEANTLARDILNKEINAVRGDDFVSRALVCCVLCPRLGSIFRGCRQETGVLRDLRDGGGRPTRGAQEP